MESRLFKSWFWDLEGRIETAEKLGAEARQVIVEYSANASSYII
ncbi:hypothetical protein NX023_08205 [Cytobacillus firmus]|nr:hypothetical protein [Cytobacillus firmus]